MKTARSRPHLLDLAVGLFACLTAACSHPSKQDAPTTDSIETMSGGKVRQVAGAETGVGWSISAKTDVAVTEALSHAGAHGKSDLTIVLYTTQHSAEAVLSAVRAGQGESQRVIGMSSHEGVLTAEGYHWSPDGAVGVLSIRDPSITVGVGGASFDEAAAGESARLAFHRAAQDAGKTNEKPSMLLLFANRTTEEAMLAALTEEIGPDVPLVGGTAAGRASSLTVQVDRVPPVPLVGGTAPALAPAVKQDRAALAWSMIANGRRISTGASVAAFYSNEPFVYSYGGGFMPDTSVHGVITAAATRVIRTIDGKPAFEVYDKWQDGRATKARARGESSLPQPSAWLSKHYSQNGVLHDQFVHVFFPADTPDALFTNADVVNGEVLYRAQGTWDMLWNRFASLPREALDLAHNVTPVAGLFFYCGGALDPLAPTQRGALSFLVSRSMGVDADIPWLGVFTWGEQGHVQGVGNLHGNLMASAFLFPAKDPNAL